jgi:hypothetical protein
VGKALDARGRRLSSLWSRAQERSGADPEALRRELEPLLGDAVGEVLRAAYGTRSIR